MNRLEGGGLGPSPSPLSPLLPYPQQVYSPLSKFYAMVSATSRRKIKTKNTYSVLPEFSATLDNTIPTDFCGRLIEKVGVFGDVFRRFFKFYNNKILISGCFPTDYDYVWMTSFLTPSLSYLI